MSRLKRGLFIGAFEYTRMIGNIVNQKLVEMVKAIAEQIGLSLGQRIFNNGLEHTSAFLANTKLMEIFSITRKWIDDDAFIFWLGTNLFVNNKSWLVI